MSTKVVVHITDQQAKQFQDAIEVLDPVDGYETVEAMVNGLIEEFCRNMGIGWTYGKVEKE